MDCHSGSQRLRAQSLGMAEMCGRLKGEILSHPSTTTLVEAQSNCPVNSHMSDLVTVWVITL